MSLSFSFTSLAASWDIISNPDATAWEKINAIFVSMPMGIMSGIEAMTSMKDGIFNLILAITAKSAASKEETITTAISSVANMKKAISEGKVAGATRLHAGV
mgnify:CR=1 FL=1